MILKIMMARGCRSIYMREGHCRDGNAPLEMRNNYYLTNTLADVVPTLTT